MILVVYICPQNAVECVVLKPRIELEFSNHWRFSQVSKLAVLRL